MTLSARTSTLGRMVRPICLAAFRLMMNSNSGQKDNCQNKEAKILVHFFYCYLRPLVSLLTLSLLTSHFFESCLMNPEASISCTKLASTKLFGSAAAALGVRGAMSSSSVLMPAGSAYGTSNKTAMWFL